MKFALAYYLLLIYSTMLLQPLVPFAEDALSHCFAEAYHVATVHAKYGNNHVEKEIADEQKDDSSKSQTTIKAGEQIPVHISVKEEVMSDVVKHQSKINFFSKADKLAETYIFKNIPPPKISYNIFYNGCIA